MARPPLVRVLLWCLTLLSAGCASDPQLIQAWEVPTRVERQAGWTRASMRTYEMAARAPDEPLMFSDSDDVAETVDRLLRCQTQLVGVHWVVTRCDQPFSATVWPEDPDDASLSLQSSPPSPRARTGPCLELLLSLEPGTSTVRLVMSDEDGRKLYEHHDEVDMSAGLLAIVARGPSSDRTLVTLLAIAR